MVISSQLALACIHKKGNVRNESKEDDPDDHFSKLAVPCNIMIPTCGVTCGVIDHNLGA